jgi:hypothetical protein
MDNNVHQCANCHQSMTPHLKACDQNRKVSHELFNYGRCAQCGLISLQNVPADLGRYYAGDYFKLPSSERLKQMARQQNSKMAAITPYASGKRLLEIGPGVGMFAQRAVLDGYEVEVIERDPACCQYLSDQLGVKAHQSDRPEKTIKSLPQHDVIALWHVIEHIKNPFELLEAAAANLRSGGVLVLGTPNPDAYQFKLMQSAWPHLDAPRHVHLIPANVLIEKCRTNGLALCRLTTDDADARSWSRFGWQRLLMNRLPGKAGTALGFGLGAALSVLFSPVERAQFAGSAYTLTMRKR